MSTHSNNKTFQNPFLKWLATPEISPPYPINPQTFQKAWDTVSEGYKTSVRKMKQTPSIKTFRQWRKKASSLDLLTEWFNFVGKYCSSEDNKAIHKIHTQITNDNTKREKNARPLKDFLSHLSYKKNLSPEEKSEIRVVRDELIKPQKDILDRVEPIIEKKEGAFYKNHEGLHFQTAHRLTGINQANIAYARHVASQQGYNGLTIKKSVSLLNGMIESCHNRNTREELWNLRQESPFNEKDAHSLISARNEMSAIYGHDSYGHYQLQDRVHKNPHSLLNVFEHHLRHGASVYNQLMDMLEYFGREKMGISKMEDWDNSFLLSQLEMRLLGSFPSHMFPIVRTIQVVVPELVAITGWSVEFMTILGEGANQIFQWRLSRNNEVHDLWIAPFKCDNQTFLADEGNATYIRVGSMKKMHGFIQLFRNHKDGFFDQTGLATLVHEVGHFIHWLSVPSKEGKEYETGATDFSEFPSILLENMAYDPKALERWACEKRSARFWYKAAHSGDLSKIYNGYHMLLSGYVDLKVNTDQIENVHDFCNSLADTFGIRPRHKDSNLYFEYTMWLGYGASDYIYWMSYAANSAIHPNIMTAPNAEKIARLFRKLDNSVLSKSLLSTAGQHAGWKEVAGEALLTSVRKGGISMFKSFEKTLKIAEQKVMK